MREEKLARKPELLLPAKDLEVLKTAVRYGADAVYIGGEAYGLRAKARNFSRDDMAEGIRYAHAHGVKVFVTANILAHNSDLAGAEHSGPQQRSGRGGAVFWPVGGAGT